MENGGYAPDATNSIKRLNNVTRKWEHMLTAPKDCVCILCNSLRWQPDDSSEDEGEEEDEEEEEEEEEEEDSGEEHSE